MPDVTTAVRDYLLAKPSVTALIGQRMYLDMLPQNASLPSVVIYKVSGTHLHKISDREGFIKSRLTIVAYASTRLVANSIIETIYKSGIAAFRGLQSSILIRGIQVDSGQQNYIEYARDGGDDHRYVTEFDLMVSYQEQ